MGSYQSSENHDTKSAQIAASALEQEAEHQTTADRDEPPPYEVSSSITAKIPHLDLYQRYLDGKVSGWLRWDFIVPGGAIEPAPVETGNKPWFAALCIVAKDLPTLMRTGFYWDERNVLENQGSVIEGPGAFRHEKGYQSIKYTRQYPLSEMSDDPTWIGCLEVYSNSMGDLGRFRINHLAREDIIYAHAMNPRKELVWEYLLADPDLDVNTICKDSQLEGWWPPARRNGKA